MNRPGGIDPMTRLEASGPEAIGIERRPGTYVVVLQTAVPVQVRIGALGMLELRNGVYLYVGSAFGPGGVAARCAHHLRIAARPRWHLDYLRPHCCIRGFWVAYDVPCLEHVWAVALGLLPGAGLPLPRFGAGDCRCPAHLYHFAREPMRRALAQALAPARRFVLPRSASGC
jgi:Uri superfamily endonuclease